MTEAYKEKRITIEYDFLYLTNFKNQERNHSVFMFKIVIRKKYISTRSPLNLN